jgi:hypothetical protein
MKLYEDFYSKKMKLNPFDKAPPSGFKLTLLKWLQNATLEAFARKEILLDTHYRFDCVGSMVGLKEVINMPKLASFL